MTHLLCDPEIRAVLPPWGGEVAIDMVDLLDGALAVAEPTWLVGHSDISTLLVPLTTRLGWATIHGDVKDFGRKQADEGLVVFLEACEDNAATICRTHALDHPALTQRDAVLDALGRLGIPIVFDLEIGHVGPHPSLVNGAVTTVTVDGDERTIVQERV